MMYPNFDIEDLSAEKLLLEWKWLVCGTFELLAVNAFGDLFLEDSNCNVHWLDITNAAFSAIAASAQDFTIAAATPEKRNEWLLEGLAEQAARRGFRPGKGQCVGYKIPAVFKESATSPNNLYVADLYEFVSFMGDVHNQMKNAPDGSQIRLKVVP
jgi:hypothetical protein